MKKNSISVMIGGEAGAGITRSGFLLAKTFLRSGLFTFGTNDYQSLIKGGHNFYLVHADAEEVFSQKDSIDLLLALNDETILLHKNEISRGGGILYDGEEVSPEDFNRNNLNLFSIPLNRIVKSLNGPSIIRNTVAIGATIQILNFSLETLKKVIIDTFGPKVGALNQKAAEKGYKYAFKHFEQKIRVTIDKPIINNREKILLTGAEAIGLGAIHAGCKFFAAYPMTPATPILHFLASLNEKHQMIVIQTESEIAAINMVAGASFAGARAMTATSGGGFCLMSEGLGMIGMTEVPAVILLAQRPGPSTGLPTHSAQGDLRFALHASQGDFPRIVIAPGDIDECFFKTIDAFNLVEKFQIPAIIISDKYLIESHGTTNFFDTSKTSIDRGLLLTEDEYNLKEEYKRHKITETGISPRVLPGTNGAIVRTNADEHDEFGLTTEDPELTTKMANKRFKKFTTLIENLKTYETTNFFGPEIADITILSWGSTKGPIRESMKSLETKGLKSNYLQIIYLSPFPQKKVEKVLQNSKKTVIVENNQTSQLSSLIREHLLIDVDYTILQYDGRPFTPRGLTQKILEVS